MQQNLGNSEREVVLCKAIYSMYFFQDAFLFSTKHVLNDCIIFDVSFPKKKICMSICLFGDLSFLAFAEIGFWW